jgi:cysteine synthase A
LEGKIDAFVCSAGTGGTIAGISRYLKKKSSRIQILLADPEGSGLYNRIKYGLLYAP